MKQPELNKKSVSNLYWAESIMNIVCSVSQGQKAKTFG